MFVKRSTWARWLFNDMHGGRSKAEIAGILLTPPFVVWSLWNLADAHFAAMILTHTAVLLIGMGVMSFSNKEEK